MIVYFDSILCCMKDVYVVILLHGVLFVLNLIGFINDFVYYINFVKILIRMMLYILYINYVYLFIIGNVPVNLLILMNEDDLRDVIQNQKIFIKSYTINYKQHFVYFYLLNFV